MVFFVVFLITTICTIIEHRRFQCLKYTNYRSKNSAGALLIFILMFLICALRDVSVGIDTEHYYEGFHQGTTRKMELGYWAIRAVALCFSNSFHIFIAAFAFVSIYPVYKFLKKESCNIAFSFLVYLSFSNYFYPETFNTIRATASIAMYLMGLSALMRKEYVTMSWWAIMCVFFHNQGLVIITLTIIAFLFVKNIPKKLVYILLIVSVIFGLSFNSGFSQYADMLSLWMAQFSGDAADYYIRYVARFEETSLNIVGTLANMLPFTLFAIVLYDNQNSQSLYYKLYLIGTLMSNIFISVSFVYRITMYFSILLIVILPNTFIRSMKSKRTILLIMTFLMGIWYIYKLFGSTSDTMAGIIPYKFFFV